MEQAGTVVIRSAFWKGPAVMQLSSSSFESPLTAAANQLVTLLERHRAALPFAEEELARHQALQSALAERHARSEDALSAWRSALSQRWECEVRAQRTFSAVHRLASPHLDTQSAYHQLVAASVASAPVTHTDLLADLRRLAASLALLMPPPPFVASCLADLQNAADALAAAIDRTIRCEATRKQMLLEERLTTNLYQRTCAQTHQLIASHFADAPLSEALPPLPI
jgi:hypothetical protein